MLSTVGFPFPADNHPLILVATLSDFPAQYKLPVKCRASQFRYGQRGSDQRRGECESTGYLHRRCSRDRPGLECGNSRGNCTSNLTYFARSGRMTPCSRRSSTASRFHLAIARRFASFCGPGRFSRPLTGHWLGRVLALPGPLPCPSFPLQLRDEECVD